MTDSRTLATDSERDERLRKARGIVESARKAVDNPDDYLVGVVIAFDALDAEAARLTALLAEQAATIAAVADFADHIERQAPKPQVGGFFAEEIRTLLGSQRTEGQG